MHVKARDNFSGSPRRQPNKEEFGFRSPGHSRGPSEYSSRRQLHRNQAQYYPEEDNVQTDYIQRKVEMGSGSPKSRRASSPRLNQKFRR
jgi:hypothetical protein